MGRFKDEFIGTGEGAATYGHGHYVAENIDTATAYRDAGSRGKREIVTSPGVESDVVDFLQGALHELRPAFNTPADLATADLKESLVRRLLQEPGLRRVIDAIDKGEASVSAADKGNIYKATLKAADEDFLLWDKPLSQQSEKVQKALRDGVDGWGGETWDAVKDKHGGDWYQFGTRNHLMDYKRRSEFLKQKGIKGIKYADQGSRDTHTIVMDGNKYAARSNRTEDYGKVSESFQTREAAEKWVASQGTSNYVVFDPADLEILRILGITGAVAGGASQIPQRAQNGPQS
jgi:hypothetical protein